MGEELNLSKYCFTIVVLFCLFFFCFSCTGKISYTQLKHSLLTVLFIVFIFWTACGRFNFPSQWCKDSSSKSCTWNDSHHKEWSVENCWTLLQFHTSCHWWTGIIHYNNDGELLQGNFLGCGMYNMYMYHHHHHHQSSYQ